MGEKETLIKWAREEASRLKTAYQGFSGGGHGGYSRPFAAAALEFLRRHAPGSEFQAGAESIFADKMHIYEATHRVGDILSAWADFVESDMAEVLPRPVEARIVAATDLMEQVQRLLDDPQTVPAAPVALAGAALEEFLRSQVAATGVTVTGKPGINSYANALRAGDHLTAQDVKDITAWAGQRNEAAHGEFEKLTRERAQLMVDGINLFLRQKTGKP